MRPLLLLSILLAASFSPVSASSIAGPEWKTVQFETIDGELISIRRSGDSSLSINIEGLGCATELPEVAVGPHPDLSDIGYFIDSDTNGEFRLLTIPAIDLTAGKQIHKRLTVYIRNCGIERIETEQEAVFPG